MRFSVKNKVSNSFLLLVALVADEVCNLLTFDVLPGRPPRAGVALGTATPRRRWQNEGVVCIFPLKGTSCRKV